MANTDYSKANTMPLGDYYVDRAAAGPHSHWSAYDLSLEGSRYQGLHAIISAIPFDGESAGVALLEIQAFAHGYGWGQADSYLADMGSSPDDSPAAAFHAENRHRELFEAYDETDYFECVFKSENILKAAAATSEALELAGTVSARVMAAFEAGRDSAIDKAEPASGPRR